MYWYTLIVVPLLASPWLRPSRAETTPIPVGECQGRDEDLRTLVQTLTRQMMLQQLAVEEKARSDGDSGLKIMRLTTDGSRPFYANSHISYSVAAIHDHTDHAYTVGMGELQAVLNGVEFRTRHNDYLINRPSTTSDTFLEVERIPYPDVPQEVLDKNTVEEQVLEMREWFKAWQNEDHSVRDYRNYFKPLLCYMEGAWTTSSGDIDEPFESDRHFLDAKTWFELQEKVRYTAYTGSKDNGENLAYLPTTIIGFNETTGDPIFAQWNFRIVCHPVSRHIPLSYFRNAGDLHARLARRTNVEDYGKTRAARFTLSQYNQNRGHRWDFLDQLMTEIPGLDNYGADLRDDTFNLGTLDPFTQQTLNSGYYHRWYLMAQPGAMGSNIAHRGFNDRNVFMAENTRKEVAGVGFLYCENGQDPEKGECTYNFKRMSYAFPLEIVYLTPLHAWNPYDIEYKGKTNSELGRSVTAGGRNGGFNANRAYNGTHQSIYYRTPSSFFSDGEINSDDADTLDAFTGVLDRQGNVQNVTASGVRIHLPAIPGISHNVRTRYPIMPVYGEGNTVWKELEALRTMVMDIPQYKGLFEVDPGVGGGDDNEDNISTYYTSITTRNPPGNHRHSIELSESELTQLRNGQTLERTTSIANNHAHVAVLEYSSSAYRMASCDGRTTECWDGHTMELFEN